MSEYKIVTSPRGGDIWMKDGRFIKNEEMPEGEIKVYRNECLFCSNEGTHKRLLNGRRLPVCNDHYYTTTLGKLAQAARESGL